MGLFRTIGKLAGGTAGLVSGTLGGAKVGLLVAPFTGPAAPFVLLGSIVAGAGLFARAGYKAPVTGLAGAAICAAGIPVPPIPGKGA